MQQRGRINEVKEEVRENQKHKEDSTHHFWPWEGDGMSQGVQTDLEAENNPQFTDSRNEDLK